MLYHFIDGGIVLAKLVIAVEGHEIHPVGTDVLAYLAKSFVGFITVFSVEKRIVFSYLNAQLSGLNQGGNLGIVKFFSRA